MAPADVEWVFGVVRAGRDYQGMEHAKSGGAGYEFTATIIVRGRTAEIVGGAGRLTPALAKEIEIALYSHGITTAIWERFNGDPKRLVRATRGRTPRGDETEPPTQRSRELNIDAREAAHGADPAPVPLTDLPLADMPASRGLQSGFRSLSAGLGNVRYGLNGLSHGFDLGSHDSGGACCQRLAGAHPPMMEPVLRQKVGSR